MKIRTSLILTATHGIALALGFAAGIYVLPILIAPPAPSSEQFAAASADASFTAEFSRDLKGSDAFHWGEGQVFVGPTAISHTGRLSPGPDYKLYLSPQFVETEAEFERIKSSMALVGDVKTFNGFVVPVPTGIDPSAYTSVVIWCESFGEFITATKYR